MRSKKIGSVLLIGDYSDTYALRKGYDQLDKFEDICSYQFFRISN